MQINPKEVYNKKIIYNIQDPKSQIQQNGIDLTLKESVVILPKSFINIEFNEKFDMNGVFAITNVRSSYSRKGIFTTSGIYDDGFKGIGGISIYNMSDDEVQIDKGIRICQMIVFESNSASKYNGIYNDKENIISKLEN